jgi:N6-L-threonylcarbamoyladenine synthase
LLLLAIETSCDDTCAAVVEDATVRSSIVSSQAALHERYGGVVPEVASRHHLQLVNAAVNAALDDAGVALDDVEAIAATRGPGLIGALLVGLSTAKAIAAARRLPLIPVDHLHGHVAANFLEPEPLEPPFLCLIASGGHTLLAGVRKYRKPQGGPRGEAEEPPFDVLGTTLDDAAGEALDKASRLLGLGYPGGPAIERAAEGGDPDAFELPVAMARDPGLDFSFSGLKTALVYLVRELSDEQIRGRTADLAASFQNAVVSQLVAKVDRALEAGEWEAVALGGGVAANSLLRERVAELCERRGLRLKLVGRELCTDNAAMIGAAAQVSEPIPYPGYLGFDAFSNDDHSLQPA